LVVFIEVGAVDTFVLLFSGLAFPQGVIFGTDRASSFPFAILSPTVQFSEFMSPVNLNVIINITHVPA